MAVNAETVVVTLEGRTGQLDSSVTRSANTFDSSMSQIERSATQAERTVESSSRSIVASQNAVGFATRNLGFQVSDVGQQLGGGQSPFIIFAQQAPQFVQAFQDISAAGGTLGQVLRGIALPGFIAVISIAGAFASKMLEGADAAETKASAVKTLAEAIRDMEKASRQAIQTGQREIFVAQAQATAYLAAATAKREQIKAQLQERINAAETPAEGQPEGGIDVRQTATNATLSRLRTELAQQDTLVQAAEANVRRTSVRIRQQAVQESLDPVLQATNRYERAVDLLNRRAEQGRIGQAAYSAELRKLIQTRDAATKAAQAGASSSTALADADALAASASNGLQRAQANLAQVRAKAREELRNGTISQTEYTARVAEAERGVNAAKDAAKSHSQALREQAKEAREAAAAQKELAEALKALEDRLFPTQAAVRQFNEQIETIDKAQTAGLLNRANAADLRVQAVLDRAKAFTKAQVEGSAAILGPTTDFDELVKNANASRDAELEGEREVNDRARQLGEDRVRSLAGLLEDAFTLSSDRFWDNFQRNGLRTLALLAARAVVMSFSQGGGGFGSLLGNLGKAASGLLGGGIPGFATGGSMLIGGRSGVDQNLLSLNGQPIARVSRGETLNVNPGSVSPRGSGGQRVFNISVDARNSVTPAGFAQDLSQRILTQAAQMDVDAGRATLRQTPGYVATSQRFGQPKTI